MPSSVQLTVRNDRSRSIREAIHDVQITLIATTVLVVMVIFLFLRKASATLIPALSLPISLLGTVALITFPGDYKTYMTGIGVYYPDGRETQRKGIVPDIEIKPAIKGIQLKKDEVLEKAIEILNK